MRKLKIYLSHCISDGGVLTEEIMQKNCGKAVEFANWLRAEFPSLEVYCPAEHEYFVHKTYTKNMLTIPQILEIDCDIIRGCEGVMILCHNDKISAGMQIEIDFALKNKIPMQRVDSFELDRPFLLKQIITEWCYEIDRERE